MDVRRIFISAMVVIGAGALVFSGAAQTASQQKRASAVTAIRAINTAEMRFQQSSGHHASYSELVASGQFANIKTSSVLNVSAADESDAVPGYKMQLIVAGSGASYSVVLTDASNPCETAFFTDERGVIYQGQGLGCTQ